MLKPARSPLSVLLVVGALVPGCSGPEDPGFAPHATGTSQEEPLRAFNQTFVLQVRSWWLETTGDQSAEHLFNAATFWNNREVTVLGNRSENKVRFEWVPENHYYRDIRVGVQHGNKELAFAQGPSPLVVAFPTVVVEKTPHLLIGVAAVPLVEDDVVWPPAADQTVRVTVAFPLEGSEQMARGGGVWRWSYV